MRKCGQALPHVPSIAHGPPPAPDRSSPTLEFIAAGSIFQRMPPEHRYSFETGHIESERDMTTTAVPLTGIHHVAYRCHDAKATVEWYSRVLGMAFTTAFAEDHVPSTGEYDPYMHVFLDCGGGNVVAFFELPHQPEMGCDPNTPAWVQHLALKVADFEGLMAAKAHIEAQGIDVLGPTWHGIFRSIYFFDPNGHRLELVCNIGTPEQYAELARVAPLMLEEWSTTRQAPHHADWLHHEPQASAAPELLD
jgi:glyoxylase I family protein